MLSRICYVARMTLGPIRSLRLSRPLLLGTVLFALFTVVALQALEVTHSHALEDGAPHCLVCKADSGVAIQAQPLQLVVVTRVGGMLSPPGAALSNSAFLLPPARGPPTHS